MNRLTASAPAKIILCGEHAVVYDAPAIAIPVIELETIAMLQPGQDDFCIFALDTDETITPKQPDHPLMITVINTLMAIGAELPRVSITIQSTIPIGSGLGSGASVATAIVKLLYQYHNHVIDYTKINSIVYQTEELFHGTPSGIDNTVIVYEKPVYFQKRHPIKLIHVGKSLHFIIADSGTPGSTKQMVSTVASLYEAARETTQHTIRAINDLVIQSRHTIETGQDAALGELLTQNHTLLQQLQVSTPKLDHLVDTAIRAGALGAKLSGSGGGGNMIALVHTSKATQVVSALQQAGATRITQTTLHESTPQ